MLLIVEDRLSFHLLPSADSRPRSTELALRHMGWLDLAARPASIAPLSGANVAASLPATDTGAH